MQPFTRWVGIVSLIPLASAHAQALRDTSRVSEARTVGAAQRSVQPDLATISVQFTAQGSSPALASNRLAARADSLRRALGTLGIPQDSLVNRSRWYWWPGRIEIIPGPERCKPRCDVLPHDIVRDTTYRATDAIEVRIHDLNRVGAVLDTLTGRGVTDIQPVQFAATDISAAQDQALREATLRARAQAEAIATASGVHLGRVLSLSTWPPEVAERYSPFDGIISAGTAVPADLVGTRTATVIIRPAIPVAVTVYGRWELVPK